MKYRERIKPERVEALLQLIIRDTLRGFESEIHQPHPCRLLINEAVMRGVQPIVDHILIQPNNKRSINGRGLDLCWTTDRFTGFQDRLEVWVEGRDVDCYPDSVPIITCLIKDAGFEPQTVPEPELSHA